MRNLVINAATHGGSATIANGDKPKGLIQTVRLPLAAGEDRP